MYTHPWTECSDTVNWVPYTSTTQDTCVVNRSRVSTASQLPSDASLVRVLSTPGRDRASGLFQFFPVQIRLFPSRPLMHKCITIFPLDTYSVSTFWVREDITVGGMKNANIQHNSSFVKLIKMMNETVVP